MAQSDGYAPIEADGHILRARRTAAYTRITMGFAGVALIVVHPHLMPHPTSAMIGFGVILLSSLVQVANPRLSWLAVEEGLSGIAGILIIGLAGERVDAVALLWMVAVTSGVMARGGRVHYIGRYIVLCSMLLPVARYGHLSLEYAIFAVATLSLLLTAGRLTRELNHLLSQARLHADSVETLLLAGDIAARMADRADADGRPLRGDSAPARPALRDEEIEAARSALAQLVEGDGLSMVVQPIVDIRSGTVHAYEALARFGTQPAKGSSPLHWFAMADELGARPALERACLRQALELFPHRPVGTSLTVNLSAPVLLEGATMAMLADLADSQPGELEGLVIEITEETLVQSDEQLQSAIAPLRERGARLAVDDMGAGYSGLRQITTVLPTYLKLDKALVTGIDSDPDRAALVGALAGYATQVGGLLIAEGIETEAELQELRRLGVPLVQGYHLGRPGEPWPEIDDSRVAQGPLLAPGAGGFLDPTEWLGSDAAAQRRSARHLTTA
jgi:EAL domain-containing protein (putative c-di-GMP-specific phosphodiesterase class I)